jgi:oligopeptide transport system substrate-binding protein
LSGATETDPIDPRIDDPGGGPEPQDGRGRMRLLAPLLLVGAMVSTALLAAYTVTPQPDRESLARPASADLVIAGSIPVSWDPAAISDAASAQTLAQVYEGLTVLDAEAALRPALAASWTIADDGLSATFHLRPDLTFSDGTPIGAEDVRRSWLRFLDPARDGPFTSLLDDVVGAAAYAAGRAAPDDVGIEADGSDLTVRFRRPASYFPAVAAVPGLAVVPPGIDERDRGDAIGPVEGFVASGAYVPTGVADGALDLVANEAYWAGPPPIERVTVLTDVGGRSPVDVYEDGAVDWIPVTEADAAWIRFDSELGPDLRRSDEMTVDFLGFDTTRPPFDDVRVRRAVGMAVDWRGIATLGAPSRGEPVTSLLPPGIAGRDARDHLPPHDPARARSELAAAGYPGGAGFPPVAIMTYGAGASDAIATALRNELGIDVEVEERPFAQHSTLLDTDPPPLWTLAWNADFPHAHDILGLLLRSDSASNSGGWSEPRFDELIAAAASSTDGMEQQRLYGEAQDILADEVPIVPLGYGGTWALSREGLLGAAVSGVGILRYAGLAWDR